MPIYDFMFHFGGEMFPSRDGVEDFKGTINAASVFYTAKAFISAQMSLETWKVAAFLTHFRNKGAIFIPLMVRFLISSNLNDKIFEFTA